jgi:two-component system sensor histidine kinase KdpD
VTPGYLKRPVPAPYALPAAFTAFIAIGTAAAALHGQMTASGVLIACATISGLMSLAAVPAASPLIAGTGWLTVAGFSRPPYAVLNPSATVARDAAVVIGLTSLACASAAAAARWQARRHALPGKRRPAGGRAGAMATRRLLAGMLLAAAVLPSITVLLSAGRQHLDLTDDLLAYLAAVVAVTVAGGFWAAVLAAATTIVLFTQPYHVFSSAQPRQPLALLLFITVAAVVASIVHLTGQRAARAASGRAEAERLLKLALTVLGGDDTPQAILDHLTRSYGGQAELLEQAGGHWVPVASSGDRTRLAAATRIDIRPGLVLRVTARLTTATPSLLAGHASQAAAALERQRLRAQTAEAEARAEGSRTREALLAAVSHDLRTPLAAVKAGVSGLRQADVHWTTADHDNLLAIIDDNAGQLDTLIGGLLDLSHLNAGSLQPYLRPVAISQVLPAVLPGFDGTPRLETDLPDGLPLALADPDLLERMLANLIASSLRRSPSASPTLRARLIGGTVQLDVIDHGPAVPDELKPNIFEPFPAGEHHPCAALGLAVAKGFTEAMGGAITAVDTPGGGLTVRVTLPTASADKFALGTGQ